MEQYTLCFLGNDLFTGSGGVQKKMEQSNIVPTDVGTLM